MRSQQEYVLRTVEERAVRFVQLWFTDVLGTPKSFCHHPGRARERPRGGHDLRRVGHRRLLPGPGERRARQARREDLPDPALLGHPTRSPVARVFCDIFNLDGTPFEGCPRHVLRRTSTGPASRGFTFFAAPEIEYFYFANPEPSEPPVTLDTGLVLRAHRHRRGQRPPQAQCAHARGDGHPRRARPARGRAQPARDRPALHRRADDGRHRHDGAARGERDRPAPGRARQLHAQAADRGAGIGHAHPLLAVRGRHATPSTTPRTPSGCPRWPSEFTAGSSRTPTRSPRSPTSGSTPTSAWSSATRRRSTCRGPATTAPPSSGSRSIKRNKHESTRIEYRAPDTACNPYLAFAVILAAGLKGIEEGYELPRRRPPTSSP